jgi:hypothetical protein
MCSKIWSRSRAVLAALFSTLARLATAAARTTIPLHGALHITSVGEYEGFITGLGRVEMRGFAPFGGPDVTLADGSHIYPVVFTNVIHDRYIQNFYGISEGTGSLVGAGGSMTLSFLRGPNPRELQVSGALILP